MDSKFSEILPDNYLACTLEMQCINSLFMSVYTSALISFNPLVLTNQVVLKNHVHYQLTFSIYSVVIWKFNITDFFFTFAVECFIFSGWGGEKHTYFIIPLWDEELLKLHFSSDKDCKSSLLGVNLHCTIQNSILYFMHFSLCFF
jgi:hypothetical protein